MIMRFYCIYIIIYSFSKYIYCIAQNFGRVKLWRIDGFRVFGKENVGEFTKANYI